jgi:hypothetical protein
MTDEGISSSAALDDLARHNGGNMPHQEHGALWVTRTATEMWKGQDMTTLDTPTFDQVLRLARRLPAADQARLVAHLTAAMAATRVEAPPTAGRGEDEDPWAVLARVREEFRALGPVSPSVTEELLAARR